MSDTNINAYKAELIIAERELDRAQSRVDELKSHIETVEPSKKAKKVEPEESKSEKIEVKTSRKGK